MNNKPKNLLQRGLENIHDPFIRELENILERAYLIESSEEITAESCPTQIIEPYFPIAVITFSTTQSLLEVRCKAVDDIEYKYLKQLITENDGYLQEIAKIASIGECQLYNLLIKYKIHKNDYKLKMSKR